MSRMILALAIFVAVLLVIFVPLGILESRRTPDWQSELSRYLNTSGVPVRDIQHMEVAEAQNPRQFAAHRLKAMPPSWTWSGIGRVPPPDWVQCVRIERQRPARWGTTPPVRSEYLLLSYHDDGQWHVGWLVHEFRGDVNAEEQQGLLTKMGCNNWVEISAHMLYQPSSRNSLDVVRTPNAIELFETQTAPTPTPAAVPTRRSDPTAEPTPQERHFPPSNAPLSVGLVVPRWG